MASKKKWKARAERHKALAKVWRDEADRYFQSSEYHRLEHNKAAEALQLATTTPDTRKAHEEGFKRGVEHASRQLMSHPARHMGQEREVNLALLPVMNSVVAAQKQLDTTAADFAAAFKKIEATFHPELVPDEPDAPEEEEENVLAT